MFQQAKDDVMAWKAHQLRSVNQVQAKFDVLDILNRGSASLVMDRAMKYLPNLENRNATGSLNVASHGISLLFLRAHINVVLLRSKPSCMCSRAALKTVSQ